MDDSERRIRQMSIQRKFHVPSAKHIFDEIDGFGEKSSGEMDLGETYRNPLNDELCQNVTASIDEGKIWTCL
uniref:Uncharacterized protein n=1 Tax=Rhizophagus irregularis (strain DAOM 181602 / DAOM 197198 / MUCL 43194) TaxID=747089 RepID=U9U0J9_RHIID